eukprot:scaffold269903_cov28-Tisochrysis_lutea.AAC.1
MERHELLDSSRRPDDPRRVDLQRRGCEKSGGGGAGGGDLKAEGAQREDQGGREGFDAAADAKLEEVLS